MLKYTEAKKPAFFACMSPELFFEAEAMETETVVADQSAQLDIDADLDELLNEED